MSIEEIVREGLVKLTDPIPDDEVAGLVFGIGLIISDYLFKLIGREPV